MASSINTNVASMNAQRNLSRSQGDLNTAIQRLSSGLRINSAKDDAAGSAIANRMTPKSVASRSPSATRTTVFPSRRPRKARWKKWPTT